MFVVYGISIQTETIKLCLRLGSPVITYTQDKCMFVKSKKQIDIGENFNNFPVHEKDQDAIGVCYVFTENSPGVFKREEVMKFNCLPSGNKFL